MNQTPEYLLGPHKTTIIAAARELLHASAAAGVAFEIPGLVPRHVVVLGAESEIGRLLKAPAREPMVGGRRKSDLLPTEPLDWREPGEPRRWTILVTSAGHGLVGEPGAKFEHAEAKHERVDVLEAGPVLARIAALEAQLVAVEENERNSPRYLAACKMGNVLFNLSQRGELPPGWKESCRNAVEEWDNARSAARKED